MAVTIVFIFLKSNKKSIPSSVELIILKINTLFKSLIGFMFNDVSDSILLFLFELF